MLRDALQTYDGFTSLIEEYQEFAEKTKDKLSKNLIDEKYIRKEKEDLSKVYFEIILASYSRDDEIETLKESMISLIEYLEDGWNYKSYSTYNYYDMLNYISLAYLLDIDTDNFKKLAKIRDLAKSRDNILDFIINAKLNDRKVTTRLMKWGKNKRLAKVINAKSKEEAEKLMKSDYLRYWYSSQQSLYWHDSHKVNINYYTGYWSFESAAVTKILGLDDSSYRDNKYYPKDMLNWKENE